MGRRANKSKKRKGKIETRRQGTIELAVEFVECSKALDKSLGAKWWNHPLLYWSKAKDVIWLRARINEVSGELGCRYKGVMDQLFQRMGSNGNFGTAVGKAWYIVRTSALKIRDHRVFSTTLWCAFVASATPETQVLKPKFMLRQFVDEIPSCMEQGVLIAMAYGPRHTTAPSGSEILRGLSISYGLLHAELKKRSSDLSILTDGEISGVTIAAMNPPFVRYEQWLFDS
jgi:hypothetical protein